MVLIFGRERFAEDGLVVVVDHPVAEAGGDLHRRGEDAQELLEARGAELGLEGVGAHHAGEDRAVALGVELGDVEEVGIAEERAAADDDPALAPGAAAGVTPSVAALAVLLGPRRFAGNRRTRSTGVTVSTSTGSAACRKAR